MPKKTPPPWGKEGPGGRDYAQEDAAARLKQTAHLKSLKAQADAWAAQEKADIQSGAKKVPLTSREKIMADRDLAAVKTTNLSDRAKASLNENTRQRPRAKAGQPRAPGEGMGGQKWDSSTKTYVKDEPYSDLAPSKRLSSNPPAAAQSRMDANKPLKTALVRDLAPGVSRDRTAANLRADRTSGVDKQLSLGDKHQRKFMSLMNAAETGEAQEFVGQMKPGVAARTEAHSFQSKSNLHERLSEVSEQHMSENPDKYPRKPLWNQGARDTFDAAKGIAKNPANDAVDLGEKTPGATKLSAKFRRESVELAREINPAWNKAHAPVGEAALKNPAGLAQRTEAHRLQSREFNYPPANQSKDLGRAVTNTIRREQAPGLSRERLQGSETPPKGGSLMALAKQRAAQGRSIAGPDAPVTRPSMLASLKAKFGSGGGTAVMGIGSILGAANTREEYKAGLISPNKIDLKTGKVSKRLKPPPIQS